MKTLGVLLILGGVAAGLYHLTRKKAAPGQVPPDASPTDLAPNPQVDDPDIVDISGYNYGRF